MTADAQEDLTGDTPPRRCQLLVSVRDSQEAEICLNAGVDWIDLKEPDNGSLGMPSLNTAKSVHSILGNYASRSVALGELAQAPPFSDVVELSRLFPYVKLGLAGLAENKDWPEQLCQIRQKITSDLVPVIYADWEDCRAPSPNHVLDWISCNPTPLLLIDTCCKDGSHLLEHLDVDPLKAIIDRAASVGTRVLLGGSLTVAQLPAVMALPCMAIAIRGAVCPENRNDSISSALVDHWVNLVKQRIPLRTA